MSIFRYTSQFRDDCLLSTLPLFQIANPGPPASEELGSFTIEPTGFVSILVFTYCIRKTSISRPSPSDSQPASLSVLKPTDPPPPDPIIPPLLFSFLSLFVYHIPLRPLVWPALRLIRNAGCTTIAIPVHVVDLLARLYPDTGALGALSALASL